MNKFLDNRMTIYEYGNPTADVVLIQLVGDHDLHDIENEITEIRNLINKDFRFIVVKVNNWYQELTPWKHRLYLETKALVMGLGKLWKNS